MSSRTVSGRGLLNRAINALSIELHMPGYQFCGPGTHLEKRLVRGDRGINPLDAACREHDIAYSRSNDLRERHVADNILAAEERKRITTRDSIFGKRAAATAVWTAMKAKTKFGMGLKTKKIDKENEKVDTSNSKAWWYLATFTIIGSSWFIGWRDCRSRQGCKR